MFLIDGNEIIGLSRHRLVDGLGRLARAYGTPSIVIFEGAGQLDLPHGAFRHGVKVLYAGGRGRAHDEILRMVELDGAARRYTVVTPDRALGRRILARGARTAPVLLLRRALEQVERSVA
jgi:predicted RNA-binding protein with PIN domain